MRAYSDAGSMLIIAIAVVAANLANGQKGLFIEVYTLTFRAREEILCYSIVAGVTFTGHTL